MNWTEILSIIAFGIACFSLGFAVSNYLHVRSRR